MSWICPMHCVVSTLVETQFHGACDGSWNWWGITCQVADKQASMRNALQPSRTLCFGLPVCLTLLCLSHVCFALVKHTYFVDCVTIACVFWLQI